MWKLIPARAIRSIMLLLALMTDGDHHCFSCVFNDLCRRRCVLLQVCSCTARQARPLVLRHLSMPDGWVARVRGLARSLHRRPSPRKSAPFSVSSSMGTSPLPCQWAKAMVARFSTPPKQIVLCVFRPRHGDRPNAPFGGAALQIAAFLSQGVRIALDALKCLTHICAHERLHRIPLDRCAKVTRSDACSSMIRLNCCMTAMSSG